MTSKDKGIKLLKEGKFKDAHVELVKAAQENPQDPLVWEKKGSCEYYLGKGVDCVASCKKGIELNPD